MPDLQYRNTSTNVICNIFYFFFLNTKTDDEIGKLSGSGLSTGLLLIGALILMVSSIGTQASCVGDLQKWALYYAVVLLFVFVTTCILCSLVFQESTVKENLSNGWNVVDIETKRTVQSNLKCCGFNKVHDRSVLPCNFVEACEPKLHLLVDDRMSMMRGCAFVLLTIEIIGLFLTTVIFCRKPIAIAKPNEFGSGSHDGLN